jgi:hypothetical protein
MRPNYAILDAILDIFMPWSTTRLSRFEIGTFDSEVAGRFANNLTKQVDPWYRSQFETGTTGGSKNLRLRSLWEDSLFGSAYAVGVPIFALLMRLPFTARRFAFCHLTLGTASDKPHLLIVCALSII